MPHRASISWPVMSGVPQGSALGLFSSTSPSVMWTRGSSAPSPSVQVTTRWVDVSICLRAGRICRGIWAGWTQRAPGMNLMLLRAVSQQKDFYDTALSDTLSFMKQLNGLNFTSVVCSTGSSKMAATLKESVAHFVYWKHYHWKF